MILVDMNFDIFEIIIKNLQLTTYKNCIICNKYLYSILNIKIHPELYYYFSKQKLKKILYNKDIHFCKNACCPNKIHLNFIYQDSIKNYQNKERYDETLTYLCYSNEYLNEYDDILVRDDETLSYVYSYLYEIHKIKCIPYCIDCLSDYNTELYSYVCEQLNLIDLYNYGEGIIN